MRNFLIFMAASLLASHAHAAAPTTPTGIKEYGTTTVGVHFKWTPSVHPVGTTGYRIYQDGTEIGTTTEPEYIVDGLAASTPYAFQFTAYDASDNESPLSVAYNITTESAPVGFFFHNNGLGANPASGCETSPGVLDGKSVAQAWRFPETMYDRGCFGPGDNIYFLDNGVPWTGTQDFWGISTSPRINVEGTWDDPITIAGDPFKAPLATEFEGYWGFTDVAKHMVVENIDWVGGTAAPATSATLQIGGLDITFRNNRATTGAGTYVPSDASNASDCITVSGQSRWVRMEGNVIEDCHSDSVDIVGAPGPIFLMDNHISEAYHQQIKCGSGYSGGVVVKRNVIEDYTFGTTTGGCACATFQNENCGNLEALNQPVLERAQAYNVLVDGNTYRRGDRARAIGFTGWQNSTITNNVFEECSGGTDESQAFQCILTTTGDGAGSGSIYEFFDADAIAFCGDPANAAYCPTGACTGTSGAPCVRVMLPAKNINLTLNEFQTNTNAFVDVDVDAFGEITPLEGMKVWGNTFKPYTDSVLDIRFTVGATNYTDVPCSVIDCTGPYGEVAADQISPDRITAALTAGELTSGTLAFSWTAVTDNGPGPASITYNIYVNGVLDGNTAATSYVATGLVPDQEYFVQVAAVDGTGNEAMLSDPTPLSTVPIGSGDSPVLASDGSDPFPWELGVSPFVGPTITCTDAEDGSITPTISIASGAFDVNVASTSTQIWECTDSDLNTSTLSYTLVISDTTPPDTTDPVLASSGADPFPWELGTSPFVGPTITCVDDTDGALTPVLGASDSINVNVAGTYTQTWNCTDAAGNVGSLSYTVLVSDTSAAVAQPTWDVPVYTALPTATVGVAYSVNLKDYGSSVDDCQVVATNRGIDLSTRNAAAPAAGPSPVQWLSEWPTGLTLDEDTCVLSGTPTVADEVVVNSVMASNGTYTTGNADWASFIVGAQASDNFEDGVALRAYLDDFGSGNTALSVHETDPEHVVFGTGSLRQDLGDEAQYVGPFLDGAINGTANYAIAIIGSDFFDRPLTVLPMDQSIRIYYTYKPDRTASSWLFEDSVNGVSNKRKISITSAESSVTTGNMVVTHGFGQIFGYANTGGSFNWQQNNVNTGCMSSDVVSPPSFDSGDSNSLPGVDPGLNQGAGAGNAWTVCQQARARYGSLYSYTSNNSNAYDPRLPDGVPDPLSGGPVLYYDWPIQIQLHIKKLSSNSTLQEAWWAPLGQDWELLHTQVVSPLSNVDFGAHWFTSSSTSMMAEIGMRPDSVSHYDGVYTKFSDSILPTASTVGFKSAVGRFGIRVDGGGGDVNPPTVPGQPTETGATETTTSFSWTASTDDVGVTGYRVFRDGVSIDTTASLAYTDTGRTVNVPYSYTVAAFDAAGNESAQSAARVITTPDQTAPTVPGQPTETGTTSTTASFSWVASSDAVGVTGYRIFQDGVSIDTTAGLTYTATGLTVSVPYSFTVAAFDAAANESAQSTARVITPVASGGTPAWHPASGSALYVDPATYGTGVNVSAVFPSPLPPGTGNDDQIFLSWSAGDTSDDGFYMSLAGGHGDGADRTTYALEGFTAATPPAWTTPFLDPGSPWPDSGTDSVTCRGGLDTDLLTANGSAPCADHNYDQWAVNAAGTTIVKAGQTSMWTLSGSGGTNHGWIMTQDLSTGTWTMRGNAGFLPGTAIEFNKNDGLFWGVSITGSGCRLFNLDPATWAVTTSTQNRACNTDGNVAIDHDRNILLFQNSRTSGLGRPWVLYDLSNINAAPVVVRTNAGIEIMPDWPESADFEGALFYVPTMGTAGAFVHFTGGNTLYQFEVPGANFAAYSTTTWTLTTVTPGGDALPLYHDGNTSQRFYDKMEYVEDADLIVLLAGKLGYYVYKP